MYEPSSCLWPGRGGRLLELSLDLLGGTHVWSPANRQLHTVLFSSDLLGPGYLAVYIIVLFGFNQKQTGAQATI
jgi:hypothetical protein